MKLQPMPGYALVKLKKKYESGLSTEKEKYAERSEGEVIDSIVIADMDNPDLTIELASRLKKGNTVYFAPYTEGEPVKYEGDEYVFIPIKELRGVKYNA